MPDIGRSDGESIFRLGASRPGGGSALANPPVHVLKPSEGPDLASMVESIHESLISSLDVEKLRGVDSKEARRLVEEAVLSLIVAGDYPVYGELRQRVVARVADEVLGLGPIQGLLDDPAVSEVMVNGPDLVYFESNGIIQMSDVRFRDDEHVRRVGERILAEIGRRVDESTPMVDARLKDGSRVNITIPPATPRCPTITVRKFRRDRYQMEDLIAAGTLDQRMADFLGACTTYKLNVLISGGTGSGKTTFLNALSAYIPRTERIITIEDPLELALQQRHVIAMEARPPDMTGHHAITQRDLLRNALRMRPDRIIVGEVRGAEAFEMLQAMNTGHEGSLSTVHANSPRDAISRIENMVLMAGIELPVSAIREQLAAALHLIIQLQRFPDGVRRIVKVTEVTGMEGTAVTLQDIFAFQVETITADGKVTGRYRPTGLRPTFSETLKMAGCDFDTGIFIEGATR
ncbi:MAG: CpaF family protein [Chloroflexi bacterium]|nr:CpaF family protein [Chloroflexota bacterium]